MTVVGIRKEDDPDFIGELSQVLHGCRQLVP